jgi:transcriptional regulator with XRE-family HTH domain
MPFFAYECDGTFAGDYCDTRRRKEQKVRNAASMLPNEQLRRERQRRGWSREYVAEQIGLADAKTIGRWERGVAFPSSYFLQKLCALFGMLAQDLGLYQGEGNNLLVSGQLLISSSPIYRGNPIYRGENNDFSLPAPLLYDPAIPLPLTEIGGLVGRDELLDLLKQRLCTGKRSPLTALNGLPGVGKTALAIELTYDCDVQRHFSDGVLWVGLGPGPDVSGLLRRWGTLLGFTTAEMANLTNEEAWARAIRTAIGMRRMLLVIDDAWKSEEALAFKVGGPNCAYILTTRIPSVALHFANDGAFTVRELSEEEGLRLLACFAPVIVTVEPGAARALVQSVGELPLALTLIGKYLQSQTYDSQPRHLRAALEHLRHTEERLQLTILQSPLERHTSLPAGTPLSLEAVIGISIWQLDEVAQHALAMLSALPAKPHSFSEETALAVSAVPLEVLDNLINAGLLESTGPGRYTLPRPIADYASVQRSHADADERMVEYFISYVETHQADYEALEQETGNVLAALQVAYEQGMHAALIRGAIAFSPFLRARGLYELAEIHLKRAEQIARSLGDTANLARMLYYLEEIT